jgi:hypothetical protein
VTEATQDSRNYGFILLGRVIEKVTGQSYHYYYVGSTSTSRLG